MLLFIVWLNLIAKPPKAPTKAAKQDKKIKSYNPKAVTLYFSCTREESNLQPTD